MKKTLAIFLALLAAASVTLASCGNKKKPVEQGNGGSYIEDEYDDTTANTNGVGDSGTNTDTSGNNGTTGNSGNTGVSDPTANYTDTNDIVYAGVELRLRKTPSTSATAVKTVPFGTKLTRSQTNGTWDKVTVEGDTTVYYVLHCWTAASNANFQFTDCEPADVKVVTTESKVQFYLSPFVNNDLEMAVENAYLLDGFKASDFTEGYTLTRVAMNSSWVKVTFTGTVKGKTVENATFYIQAAHFTNGRLSDPAFPSQGGNSSVGGIG